jgi:hypothetical protein
VPKLEAPRYLATRPPSRTKPDYPGEKGKTPAIYGKLRPGNTCRWTGQKVGLAISQARNLVWALLIQGLLNDSKLPILLEDYGTSLKKESAFREHLKTVVSTRLLPVLKEVLGSEEYKDRMEKQRYDFLRTKEIFNQCKDVAADRFRWVKKSL